MTREEQIRKASYSADNNVHANPHPVPGVDKMFNDYFSMCFKLGAEWADQHPQWIPVEERFPDEGQVVLIHTNGGSVSTACYTDGRFDITELFQAINVTHWMPIVPPRKEERL